MSVKALIFTKNTSTGSQAVTGVGFRPTWVLLIWNGCTALNTIQSDFGFGYGCAVKGTGFGEDQGCHWSTLLDSTTSNFPNGCRIDRYTSIFVKAAAAASGSPSPTDEAVLSSCDADGFTLNWTTNSGSADLILAICGSHALAAMDNVSLFLGSPAAVTDLGFTPTAMIAMIKRTDCVGTGCTTSLASGSSSADDMGGNIGFCDENDVNGGAGWNNANGGATASWMSPSESSGIRDRRIVRFLGADGFIGISNDYLDAHLDSGGYSFSGFSLATPTWIQSFLLIGAAHSAVGHRTSSGTVSPGFTPGLAMIVGNGAGTNVADVSFGVYDGVNHYAVSASAFETFTPDTRTAREISTGVMHRVFNAPNATATSTTTKQTVTCAFGSGSATFTTTGSSNEFVYLLLEDPAPPHSNLLTGSDHAVQGSENLIVGAGADVTGNTNAIFNLSATPLVFTGNRTFKVVADNIEISLSGGEVAPIYRTSLVLNNTQIKALPSGDATLIAAPGAGKRLLFWGASIDCNAAAGAYTNINRDAWASIRIAGIDLSTYIANDPEIYDGRGVQLTRLLSASRNIGEMLPLPLIDDTGWWGLTYVDVAGATFTNTALVLHVDNEGSGNFTGGNAANTLTLTVDYSHVDA